MLPETRDALLYAQLQEGLKYELMKSPNNSHTSFITFDSKLVPWSDNKDSRTTPNIGSTSSASNQAIRTAF